MKYLNLARIIASKEAYGVWGRAGEVTDPQKPTGPCSLLEPLVAHLGGIHRLSPPCSHPLTVGSVFVEVKVSYLLLFVPGQKTKALGRKEEKAWLPPAWTQADLCSGTQPRTHIFS